MKDEIVEQARCWLKDYGPTCIGTIVRDINTLFRQTRPAITPETAISILTEAGIKVESGIVWP